MVQCNGTGLDLSGRPTVHHCDLVDAAFWVTSIVVTATPGTGALFTVAAGLAGGLRAGLTAAVGCTVGIVPHLVLALTGAAAVIASSPAAFDVVRWAGVVYLLYMAWASWRRAGGNPAAFNLSGPGRTIGNAVLVNLLNPKLTVFFFVFLPMFVDPAGPDALSAMAGLGVAFMAVTLLIFAGYGMFAGYARRLVIGRPVVMTWIGRVSAVCFIALAGALAVAPR